MSKTIATAAVTNSGEHYTSTIQIRQHVLCVDEPLDKGGKDAGPAPGDYLCAGLASCKAITLRMYAERKEWEVGEIKVTVNLVPAKEMASGKNTFFSQLTFSGNLDDEQQKRLLFVANSCPLHKLLSRESDVVTAII